MPKVKTQTPTVRESNSTRVQLLIGIAIILGQALFCPAHSHTSHDINSLKGLPKFYIVIEKTKKTFIIQQTHLRTLVEVELRKAGISFEEGELTNNAPWLYLNYNQLGTSFSTNLIIHQIVNLPRDPTVTLYGATWEKGSMGINTNLMIIRESIKQDLDIFINDYLSVNPRAH